MSRQIVISGNRILAHGEDCFLAMGGTVICPDTGKVYQNATVATVDTLPADIDSVGYEYHAGEFVPCAPFGVGSGNMAVVCGEDCKAIKDSGIPLGRIMNVFLTSYKGTGKTSFNITHEAGFVPRAVIITPQYSGSPQDMWGGYIVGNYGICLCAGAGSSSTTNFASSVSATLTDSVIAIRETQSGQSDAACLCAEGVTYNVLLMG